MRTDDQFTIPNVRCEHATAKALACVFDGDQRLHWIPRSQLLPASEVKDQGHAGRLVVTKWFAQQAKLATPADNSVRSRQPGDDRPPPHGIALTSAHRLYTELLGVWGHDPAVAEGLKRLWKAIQSDLSANVER